MDMDKSDKRLWGAIAGLTVLLFVYLAYEKGRKMVDITRFHAESSEQYMIEARERALQAEQFSKEIDHHMAVLDSLQKQVIAELEQLQEHHEN